MTSRAELIDLLNTFGDDAVVNGELNGAILHSLLFKNGYSIISFEERVQTRTLIHERDQALAEAAALRELSEQRYQLLREHDLVPAASWPPKNHPTSVHNPRSTGISSPRTTPHDRSDHLGAVPALAHLGTPMTESGPSSSLDHLITELEKFDPSDDYHTTDPRLTGVAGAYYAAVDRCVALLRGDITDWMSPPKKGSS